MRGAVLIPTYNERENISTLVPEIFAVAPSVSVLVIDDSSPDGTAGAVLSLAKKYPNLSLLQRARKNGLGAAYKDGFAHILAKKDRDPILCMDADGSHDPAYIPKLLEASAEYDLVIGSRYMRGGAIERWEWWRYLLSRWGNVYARALVRLPIKDLTSGFFCIRRRALQETDLSRVESSGYAFQIDLKYHVVSGGARVLEIPIIFKGRREGESKLSHHIIREGLLTPLRIFISRLLSH